MKGIVSVYQEQMKATFIGLRAQLFFIAENSDTEYLEKVKKDLTEITTFIGRRLAREVPKNAIAPESKVVVHSSVES